MRTFNLLSGCVWSMNNVIQKENLKKITPNHSRIAKVHHHEQVGVVGHPAALATRADVKFIKFVWKINNSGPITENPKLKFKIF